MIPEKQLEDPGGYRADRGRTRIRWELVLLLFVAGGALCIAAFVVDGGGWKGLGPSALLEFGVTVGLVGVLVILERSLLAEIRRDRPDVIVNCYVRRTGQGKGAWDTWTVARPEDELEFLVRFENSSRRTLKNVTVGNNLPKYLSYVDGSTELRNGAYPSGVSVESDNVANGGIDVGHYGPGAVGYVLFAARADPVSAYENPRTYDIRNVGIARPKGLSEHFNIAKVLLDVRA
jgi:uncharacterized repeat protein (TIGR01451 family)